jgi:hypothetical protein
MKPMNASKALIPMGLVLALLIPATPAAAATWTQAPSVNSPGSNELLGAAAASTTRAWAVGRVLSTSASPATYRSLLLRNDGDRWVAAAHPALTGNHLLRGVDAASDRDAWAVGYRQTSNGGWRTLAEHWDGTAWSVVATPNPNLNGVNQLTGVKAVPGAADTVWAVGSYSRPGGSFGTLKLIARRSGGAWQTYPTPAVTAEDFLEAVDATGPNNAWAVGWGSTSPFGGTAVAITLRWNGSGWTSVPLSPSSPVMLFGVEAIAANDVWVVGHTYPGGPHWVPAIWHFDGATWSRATIPAFPGGGQLRDIVALSPSNVYAVGLDGEGFNAKSLVLHYDGATWTREATPSPPGGPKLYGAAASGNSVSAVGYRYDQALMANQTFAITTPNG